ncbi:hypothetical protein ACOME3_005689 [Neoechinorhynchus agilis]
MIRAAIKFVMETRFIQSPRCVFIHFGTSDLKSDPVETVIVKLKALVRILQIRAGARYVFISHQIDWSPRFGRLVAVEDLNRRIMLIEDPYMAVFTVSHPEIMLDRDKSILGRCRLTRRNGTTHMVRTVRAAFQIGC